MDRKKVEEELERNKRALMFHLSQKMLSDFGLAGSTAGLLLVFAGDLWSIDIVERAGTAIVMIAGCLVGVLVIRDIRFYRRKK